MHDQLEGVLPLEVKMLLQKYIQHDKLMTLKTINERIASFEYGVADCKNKPSPLKEQVLSSNSASISQTGEHYMIVYIDQMHASYGNHLVFFI